MRKRVSEGCEKLIWDFFESGGQVVIYDANNGTREAREALAEKFDKEGIHIIFLGRTSFRTECRIRVTLMITHRIVLRQTRDNRT